MLKRYTFVCTDTDLPGHERVLQESIAKTGAIEYSQATRWPETRARHALALVCAQKGNE